MRQVFESLEERNNLLVEDGVPASPGGMRVGNMGEKERLHMTGAWNGLQAGNRRIKAALPPT